MDQCGSKKPSRNPLCYNKGVKGSWWVDWDSIGRSIQYQRDKYLH